MLFFNIYEYANKVTDIHYHWLNGSLLYIETIVAAWKLCFLQSAYKNNYIFLRTIQIYVPGIIMNNVSCISNYS